MRIVQEKMTSVRIWGALGLVLSLVFLGGTWTFMGFKLYYFPHGSVRFGYFEIVLWSILSCYFGGVLVRGKFVPWKPQ